MYLVVERNDETVEVLGDLESLNEYLLGVYELNDLVEWLKTDDIIVICIRSDGLVEKMVLDLEPIKLKWNFAK